MATLNPVPIVRDTSSSPHHQRGVHVITGQMVGGSGGTTLVVETRLKTVLSAVAVKMESSTAVPVTAIAASTAYPGSQKVTITLAAAGTYSYIITGLLDGTCTVDTGAAGGTTTLTYNPYTGQSTSA